MLKQLLKREVLLLKPVKKNILSNVKCSQLSNGEFRILFIGSDSLVSLPVLKFLHEEYRKITKTHSSISLNVLTRVLEKNLNPVAEYCLDNGLEIRNWDHLEESDGFASLKCDVGVLSSFGKLVPGELIDASKFGIVNIHPSLLPRWRGSSPLPRTILADDTHTGVSLMLLSPHKFDSGKIISQTTFEVPHDAFTEDLAKLALQNGIELLTNCLENVENSVKKAEQQTKKGVTYAFKLKTSDSEIDWHKYTVADVWRLYRALSFKFPMRTEFNGKIVKLTEMIEPKYTSNSFIPNDFLSDHIKPGTACFSPLIEAICIKCVDGFVGFKKVHIAGRKSLDALQFANGYFNLRDSSVRFGAKRGKK